MTRMELHEKIVRIIHKSCLFRILIISSNNNQWCLLLNISF